MFLDQSLEIECFSGAHILVSATTALPATLLHVFGFPWAFAVLIRLRKKGVLSQSWQASAGGDNESKRRWVLRLGFRLLVMKKSISTGSLSCSYERHSFRCCSLSCS